MEEGGPIFILRLWRELLPERKENEVHPCSLGVSQRLRTPYYPQEIMLGPSGWASWEGNVVLGMNLGVGLTYARLVLLGPPLSKTKCEVGSGHG